MFNLVRFKNSLYRPEERTQWVKVLAGKLYKPKFHPWGPRSRRRELSPMKYQIEFQFLHAFLQCLVQLVFFSFNDFTVVLVWFLLPINAVTKSSLVEEKFIHLTLYIPSIREAKAGFQGKNPETGIGAESI